MEVGFKTLQAIADLRGIAALADGATLTRVSSGEGAAIDALIREHGCRIGTDENTLSLLEPLEDAAASPDTDLPAFVTATAVLLADALQGGLSPRGLALNFSLYEDTCRALPNPHRAALMNGFETLARRCHERPFPAPSAADRMSTDKNAIVSELSAIARRMPEADLIQISQADYGDAADQHLRALNRVIHEQDCRMTQDQYWYPSEVIELITHVPGTGAFCCATALLMIAALDSGDAQGHMDYRWENNANAYIALEPSVARPVLAGFRHLNETEEWWSPYAGALFDVVDNRAVTIPLAADEFLNAHQRRPQSEGNSP